MADRAVAVVGAWESSASYSVGHCCSNDYGKVYKCIAEGISETIGGPTGIGSDITDGSVHWAYVKTPDAYYSSLNSALSAESGPLLWVLVIECFAFRNGDTINANTGTGYTGNDATHYIKITSYADNRNTGIWDESRYVLRWSNAGSVLTVGENYTQVDGIQIEGAYNGNQTMIYASAVNYLKITNNIIRKSSSGGATNIGINMPSSNGYYAFISNNIIYDIPGSTGKGITGGGTMGGYFYIYSNTIYNMENYGIQLTGAYQRALLKNNLINDCRVCYDPTAIDTVNSANNISDDNSQLGINGKSGEVIFVSEIATPRDLHLDLEDIVARHAGIDLTADAYWPIDRDIDGDMRPVGVGVWDCGADQTVMGGVIPIVMNLYRQRWS